MYTARRARCLNAACRRSPPGLTRSSASPAISSACSKERPERLSPSSPMSETEPASPKRSTMLSNHEMLMQPSYPSPTGADRMHAVVATKLIHPDHVMAEPPEPEHPRSRSHAIPPLPGNDATVAPTMRRPRLTSGRRADASSRGSKRRDRRRSRLSELGLREQNDVVRAESGTPPVPAGLDLVGVVHAIDVLRDRVRRAQVEVVPHRKRLWICVQPWERHRWPPLSASSTGVSCRFQAFRRSVGRGSRRSSDASSPGSADGRDRGPPSSGRT